MASEERPVTPAPLIRDKVVWPTQSQVVRQLGVVVAVVTVWGGAFWGAMHLPTDADTAAATASSERREARRRQAQAPEDEAQGDEAPATATADGNTPSGAAEGGPAQTAEAVPAPAPEKSEPGPAKTAAAPSAAKPPVATTAPQASDTKPGATSADEVDAATAAEALAVGDPLDLLVEDASDVGEVSFAADVMPILERRCVKCHGGERDEGGQRIEEGLNLLTWDDVMAGSIWGSVVEPGDPAASYMLELIQNGEMPDKEPRLLPKEVRIISQWIATGAPKN